MFTYKIWTEFVIQYDIFFNVYYDELRILLGVILSLITIPLDIVLSPLEIITLILYAILNKKEKSNQPKI